MKLKKLCACALVANIAIGSSAVAQWQLISPPEPGPITSIGVAGSNPDIMYVTSDPDGAWHTANGGQTDLAWLFTSEGLFQVHSTRAAIAPSNNLIRYHLDVSGSTRVTTNGGLTWNFGGCAGSFYHHLRPWLSLAIHPNDPSKVLAGGKGVISGLHLLNTCACPACPGCAQCPATPSWQCACGVPSNVVVTDIEWVVNSQFDTVWAATSDCAIHEEHPGDCAAGGVGVLGSIDGGQNWTAVSVGAPGAASNNVYAVATVPGADSYLLAATADGLWGTVDWGLNWIDLTPAALSSRVISDVVFLQGGTVYIGTAEGVYAGAVAGGTINWSPTVFPVALVTALGSAYGSPNRLYAGYENGAIYSTLNGGGAVSKINGANGTYPIATIAIKSDDDQTAYFGTVCQQGIFKGAIPTATTPTWQVLSFPTTFGSQHFHYVMRLEQDPVNANTIYGTDNDIVWKSTNAGGTWTPVLFSDHLHGLAVAPSNPQRVYAGSGFGIWGTHTSNLRVYRSDNGGATWATVLSLSPLSDTSLYDIAVSPLDPDVAYIATFGSENYPGQGTGIGVYRTLDGGATWTNASFNLTGNALFVGQIAMRIRAGVLHTYIATLDGVYRMIGAAGTNWIDITPVTPSGSRRFESIAIHPTNNNLVFAGTTAPLQAGSTVPAEIYQSTDGGMNWQQMTITMQPLTWAAQYRTRDIQVARTRAYAAVEGSGVYMFPIPPLLAQPAPVGP